MAEAGSFFLAEVMLWLMYIAMGVAVIVTVLEAEAQGVPRTEYHIDSRYLVYAVGILSGDLVDGYRPWTGA